MTVFYITHLIKFNINLKVHAYKIIKILEIQTLKKTSLALF